MLKSNWAKGSDIVCEARELPVFNEIALTPECFFHSPGGKASWRYPDTLNLLMWFDAADRRAAGKLQNFSSWIHDFVLCLKTSKQFTESSMYVELNTREKVLTERQGLYNDMKALMPLNCNSLK